MKNAAKLSFSRLPTTFDGLVRLHPPRPIHDDVGYKNTVEFVDVLAVAGPKLNDDQQDYLELLATLIERYEDDTLPPLPASSGRNLLIYLLEEHGMSGDDLAGILGVHRSIAYRILKGDRQLTTGHIKALRERFGTPADLFIR
jgi:HTH-type transcriptional regulator/antitoxin HigA